MNWGEWIEHDARAALLHWKQAAKGISRRFDIAAGHKVKGASAKQNERAFWMLIHEPLDGVRLLAVRLPSLGNSQGQIELRIWSYAARQEVWQRFEGQPGFTFRGSAFMPYTCTPQDSWKLELEREGVEVRGKAFSGRLADVGRPEQAMEVLRSLFEGFSDFVLMRHQNLEFEPVIDGDVFAEGDRSAASTTAALVASAKTREMNEEEQAESIEIAGFEAGLASLRTSEREALVKMRIGQSLFRDRLLARWNSACSVTGLKSPEVLIASHIKRWSDCQTAAERWDVNNGLLLTPSLDKAFELGLIGFEHDGIHRGRLIVSTRANWDLKDKLRLDHPQWRIRDWHQGLARYLLHHRQRWAL